MKRFLSLALLSLAALSHTPAMARTSVPIVNHENVEIVAAGGAATSAQRVQQAIMAAAAQRNWSVRTVREGELEATLVVRGKHTAVIAINYTAKQFSLTYKSSVNLNFGTQENQSIIHPNYNKWVADLKQAIQLELQKT